MLKMLSLFLSFFWSLQSLGSVVSASPIKSYREWKNEKVQLVLSQNLNLKGQILKAKTDGNKRAVDSLEKQVSQIQWNLEVVRDLSVTDYFVLYLSQQPQADRFQLAAQKMTTNEVVELMEAYADTLSIAPPAESVTRQALNQPTQPSKLPTSALRRDQIK